MTPPPQDESVPVTMLARVFAVLDAFRVGEEPELSLAELTTRTKIPKPSLYRICKEMVERGLLELSPAGFRLGVWLFELGELVSGQRELREATLPYLEELFELTHEVVNLGVLNGTDVLYYVKLVGHNGLVLPTRVGGRWPAHTTAMGKAMLAYESQHSLRRVLARGLDRLTPYTITDPRRLVHQFEEVRKEGVAFEFEESSLGVACVGAPIFDGDRLIGAVSVSGPPLHLRQKRWELTVKRVAGSISRNLSSVSPATAVTIRPRQTAEPDRSSPESVRTLRALSPRLGRHLLLAGTVLVRAAESVLGGIANRVPGRRRVRFGGLYRHGAALDDGDRFARLAVAIENPLDIDGVAVVLLNSPDRLGDGRDLLVVENPHILEPLGHGNLDHPAGRVVVGGGDGLVGHLVGQQATVELAHLCVIWCDQALDDRFSPPERRFDDDTIPFAGHRMHRESHARRLGVY